VRTAFPRTIQALRIDRFRSSFLVLLVAASLAGAWFSWFFLAGIARYEVTATARLEIDQQTTQVQSPVLGRVEASNLALDRLVTAGEVLVRLDADQETLRVTEERRRVAGLDSQVEALRQQLQNAGDSRLREREASVVALDEARARYREADALARQAEEDASRLNSLHAEGLAAKRDLEQIRFEAERRKHAAESLRLDIDRLGREQRTRESDRSAQEAALSAEIHRLEGDRATGSAAIERLEHAAERRVVRAPVSGRLAEVAAVRPGAVVTEGEKLGAIVPPGGIRIVAQFAPAAALGRIRPGQRARMRLDGYPWTQYGSVQAVVSHVGGEVRDGTVRVELAVSPSTAVSVPLQHGLPGAVEVEVERLSPAALVMRTAGRGIAAPRTVFQKP
jgi:membrane fusion protein (multidrug efflux system)